MVDSKGYFYSISHGCSKQHPIGHNYGSDDENNVVKQYEPCPKPVEALKYRTLYVHIFYLGKHGSVSGHRRAYVVWYSTL